MRRMVADQAKRFGMWKAVYSRHLSEDREPNRMGSGLVHATR